ncbi:MAG TPA: DUF2158 domain-containing protein [Methylocystis sp.]|jgi:uncharacterized protein YodC (DUF2158 family)
MADDEDFLVGDVVRLNCSATLRMTVDKVGVDSPEGAIVCVWFSADDVLQTAHFHAEQLVNLTKR